MASLPWTQKGGEMADSGIHGGRLGPQGVAALRRWAGDGERLRRCSVMSRSRRWRRLALESGDRDKSAMAALQSRAPMVAAVFRRGRRGAQATKQRGAVLWARGTGDRAVPGSDAERQRGAGGMPLDSGESGSGTRRTTVPDGPARRARAGNKSWAELKKLRRRESEEHRRT
jgi:hypothetical protein